MDNRARRRGLTTAGVGAVVVVGVAACMTTHPVSGTVSRSAAKTPAAGPARQPRTIVAGAAESSVLPWHLPRPLSREVVVPGRPGQFVVLGGLLSGDTSTADVYDVTTATGAIRAAGALTTPVHDAGGGVSGGKALVLGGGTPAETAKVQSFPLASGGRGSVTGSLPGPRSDSHAVTIGGTTYVTGGFDGSAPDAAVLATTDGRTFTTVTSLPVPVRYAGTTVLNGQIILFGGEAITGSRAGEPVSVIQAVDPVRHTATVIGSLPEPLEGAAAVTVGDEVFVAGGDTRSSGAGGTRTVSTIWVYDPSDRRLLRAGKLQVPVSYGATTVMGSTAWLAGGETNGSQVNSVQAIRPKH